LLEKYFTHCLSLYFNGRFLFNVLVPDDQDVAECEKLDEMQRAPVGEASNEEDRGRALCDGLTSGDAV
jgi:hypothetical protein